MRRAAIEIIMIDTHIHILPHIDDGARDLNEALEMARMVVAEGVTTVVATPHGPGSGMSRNYHPQVVQQRVDTLREALDIANIPLEVLPGTELYADPELPDWLRKGEVLTLNRSQTVLIEFPGNATRAILEEMIAAIQQLGYRVVLAHPERLKHVQDHPDLLIPLIGRGVLMQLTAGTLTGEQGDMMRKRADLLLTHRLIHILATDAHSATYRPPHMQRAYARAIELIGADEARALVLDNPDALLYNQPVALPTPQPIHRSLISRLF